MILLVATVCLLVDPVTVQCQTQVMRLDPTPTACIEMVPPTVAFLVEQTSALPVIAILAMCKAGAVA